MARNFTALFLLVYGVNLLCGLRLPPAVPGIIALIAGILVLAQCFRVPVDGKKDGELAG
jgi:uncharacterized membrane protein